MAYNNFPDRWHKLISHASFHVLNVILADLIFLYIIQIRLRDKCLRVTLSRGIYIKKNDKSKDYMFQILSNIFSEINLLKNLLLLSEIRFIFIFPFWHLIPPSTQ